MTTLTIQVGESLADTLQDFGQTLQAVIDGREVTPYFGVGFENMAQMGSVFSAKRWELVEVLKRTGAQSIYALAKRLNRHYRNVHQDVAMLSEWMVIEKDASGKVFVPWDEIDVQWPLQRLAA
jgi:predicted transcriptional regulator